MLVASVSMCGLETALWAILGNTRWERVEHTGL